MLKTIISNNCVGGVIREYMGLEYYSPTVALQIMPEEYIKFITNLKHYIDSDLRPVESLDPYHEEILRRLYWGEIPPYPLAWCDDILISFQHYNSYEEALEKWNRRKARVDYNDIGYCFYCRDEGYKPILKEFIALNLPRSAVFTERFDIEEPHARVDIPERGNFLERMSNGQMAYEKHFDKRAYINGEEEYYK